jgi:tryptophan synthase alpha chain
MSKPPTNAQNTVPPNRLERRFQALRREDKCGLVAFLTAGDPDPDACLAIMHALAGAGVAAIELGLPADNPALDGPVIRAAHGRVRRRGVDAAATFRLLQRFRADNRDTPVVLMGYAETYRAIGAHWFVDAAAWAGADAMLFVDPAPPERTALIGLGAARGLPLVPILNAGDGGALWLAALAGTGGFAYCVASPGKSGGAAPDPHAVAARLDRIRVLTALPLVAGFGVRSREAFAALAPHADGIAVGTALAEEIERRAGRSGAAELARRVAKFAAGFTAA